MEELGLNLVGTSRAKEAFGVAVFVYLKDGEFLDVVLDWQKSDAHRVIQLQGREGLFCGPVRFSREKGRSGSTKRPKDFLFK